MNFAEYMFLRKAAVAWKKCVPGNLMAESDAKCAIEMAANAKIINPRQIHKIVQAGLDIEDNSNLPGHLNFIVFLYITNQFKIFSSYDYPESKGYLSEKRAYECIEQERM